MIPVKHAQIEWDDGDDGKVREVLVFNRTQPPSPGYRHELYDSSAGACAMDWMTGQDPRSTPEGVFVQMAHDGFFSPDAMLQALQEFGKIDTCDWARTMSLALAKRLNVGRSEP